MAYLLVVAYAILRHPIQFIKAWIESRRQREIEQNRAAMEHLHGLTSDTWDWFEKGSK